MTVVGAGYRCGALAPWVRLISLGRKTPRPLPGGGRPGGFAKRPRRAPGIGRVLLLCLAVAACGPKRSAPPNYAVMSAAEEEFAKGANRPPTAYTQYAMVRLLLARGDDRAAETALTRLIEENPRFLPAYVELAALQLRHDRLEEATTTLHSAARLAPRDPVIANDLGMCAFLAGDYEQALSWFEQACEIAPSDARYGANRAMTLALLGRDEEALAAYEGVLAPGQARHNLDVIRRARQNLKQTKASP